MSDGRAMDTTGQIVPPAVGSDGWTFDEVLTTYQAPLLRYVTRLLNNSAYAQDIVQETFMKLVHIWRNGAHAGPNLRPWLYRVAHNLAVDHIRRESRLQHLHERDAEERRTAKDGVADKAAKNAEQLQSTLEQLRRLGPEERQVVLLRLQEGLSYREISQVTGRTEGNIGCILHHAVKKIADRLENAGLADRGGAS